MNFWGFVEEYVVTARLFEYMVVRQTVFAHGVLQGKIVNNISIVLPITYILCVQEVVSVIYR